MKTRRRRTIKWPEQKIRELERVLRNEYGRPRHHNPRDPLDDLIFVVLSRMTQEIKYLRTYHLLRAELPSWGEVRDAPVNALEDLIHDAGLARTKSRHIKAILETIQAREGRLDLSRLSARPDSEVEDYLTSLPGVSRKTARCVMLYALGRDTCPVDAHVWRIAQRLGLAPMGSWTDKRAAQLEDEIPKPLRASLHVTLLAHGRAVCRARRPLCMVCSLRTLCPRIGTTINHAPMQRSKAT
jgi:endonuclease III